MLTKYAKLLAAGAVAWVFGWLVFRFLDPILDRISRS